MSIFLKAHSPLLKTGDVQGQLSEHIFVEDIVYMWPRLRMSDKNLRLTTLPHKLLLRQMP